MWDRIRFSPRRRRRRRSGTALAELAVCLPIVVLLVLGAMEGCTMVFAKQGLTAAAYESIRVAVQKKATTAAAETAGRQIITSRKLNDVTFTFSPADVSTATAGTLISVSVQAPCATNAILPAKFFSGRLLTGRASMVKE